MITKNISKFNCEKSVFIFNHFAKCGGSTLLALLQDHFKERFYHEETSYKLLPALSHNINNKNWGKKPIAVAGHSAWGVHNLFEDDIPCSYVTFIRNPIHRLISHFRFNVITGGNSYSFEEYLRILPGNPMTHFFGGGNIDLALERLCNQYVFVGFLEAYSESLRALSDLFKFKFPSTYKIKNKTPQDIDIEIENKEMDYIEYKLNLDIELYNEVLKHYSHYFTDDNKKEKPIITGAEYSKRISVFSKNEKDKNIFNDTKATWNDMVTSAISCFNSSNVDKFKKKSIELFHKQPNYFFSHIAGMFASVDPKQLNSLIQSYLDDYLSSWIEPIDTRINNFRLSLLLQKVTCYNRLGKKDKSQDLCYQEMSSIMDCNIPWDFALTSASMLRSCELYDQAAKIINSSWNSCTEPTDDMLQEYLVNSYLASESNFNLVNDKIEKHLNKYLLQHLKLIDRRTFNNHEIKNVLDIVKNYNHILVISPYATVLAEDLCITIKEVNSKIHMDCISHQNPKTDKYCNVSLLPNGLFSYDKNTESLFSDFISNTYDAVLMTIWKHPCSFYSDFFKIAENVKSKTILTYPFNSLFFPKKEKYCFKIK